MLQDVSNSTIKKGCYWKHISILFLSRITTDLLSEFSILDVLSRSIQQ